MKQSVVILLVFLICKSTFGMGVMTAFCSMNCQSEPISVVDLHDGYDCDELKGDVEEEDDCCKGGNCECFCCGHVFVNKNSNALKDIQNPLVTKHTYNYKNEYTFNATAFIWQPPRNS